VRIAEVRQSRFYRLSYIVPARAARYAAAKLLGPTTFHYTRLKPNYQQYWVRDSDAINSMDPYEMRLWFESRGDRCETWPAGGIFGSAEALVIQVGSSPVHI
jgi:hypothetical protein